jgi:hypothetical protein
MPQIEQGYGHAMYTRVARKPYRCTHWRHLGFMDGYECGAAILPGEPYVESVCAPYYESPFYKVTTDPLRPWIETGRKPCWHHGRICIHCASKELRSYPQVRALASEFAECQ